MCEEPCLAAPANRSAPFLPGRPCRPRASVPSSISRRESFPLGLRPSVVLGSRFGEPVSGRPRPRPLPKGWLQDLAVTSRSFHSCFSFLLLYFPPCVTLLLCWASLCLALLLFFSLFSRVTWHYRKVCASGRMGRGSYGGSLVCWLCVHGQMCPPL